MTAKYCVICNDGVDKDVCVIGVCPGLGWDETPAELASAILMEAARKAIARLEALKDINIEEWARNLAADIVAAGEKEPGP